ncbi:hypothetical protein NQ317_004068 [Molorchus minor]|uniref:Uncharacterized protein n=1 Tax=Molorchus minor TaxID=1323400 RepID=A0ABQ9JM65_9CUCU|nr:hypothetical protein NQ317_004068 [Molorchus minor]
MDCLKLSNDNDDKGWEVESLTYLFYNDFQRTIYLDYPNPIKAADYSYYPYSYRTYRPHTLYYDYYWPLSSLNRYYWPRYPYYRYLYYKYTLPSDRYYHLKGRMLFVRNPISGHLEYRVYPSTPYLRHKIYKPLSLYCDYYYPIRELYWNSSYWPLYRSVSSFIDDLPSRGGQRLQRVTDGPFSPTPTAPHLSSTISTSILGKLSGPFNKDEDVDPPQGFNLFPLHLHGAKDIVSQASKCRTLPQKMEKCFFIHSSHGAGRALLYLH